MASITHGKAGQIRRGGLGIKFNLPFVEYFKSIKEWSPATNGKEKELISPVNKNIQRH